MSEFASLLTEQVKAFVQDGESEPLIATLSTMNRTDVYGQAAVRYLMKIGKWQFNDGFEPAISNLFGHYEERPRVSSEDYIESTRQIIKDLWEYEIEAADWLAQKNKMLEEVENRPKPLPRSNPVDRPVKESKAKSGSKTFKSLSESKDRDVVGGVDTRLASARLKKTIAIQRGE